MNLQIVYKGISKAFITSDIQPEYQSELLSFMVNVFKNKLYILTEKDKNRFLGYKSCYGKRDYPYIWEQIYNLYMNNVKTYEDGFKFYTCLRKYYFKFHHLKK